MLCTCSSVTSISVFLARYIGDHCGNGDPVRFEYTSFRASLRTRVFSEFNQYSYFKYYMKIYTLKQIYSNQEKTYTLQTKTNSLNFICTNTKNVDMTYIDYVKHFETIKLMFNSFEEVTFVFPPKTVRSFALLCDRATYCKLIWVIKRLPTICSTKKLPLRGTKFKFLQFICIRIHPQTILSGVIKVY